MAALVHYHDIRQRDAGRIVAFGDARTEAGRKIVAAAQAAGRPYLTAEEVYRLLEAYQIPLPGWRIAADADEAEKAAADIGFPAVVKADAESVVHKSDVGGVAVDLKDGAAVREAVSRMHKNIAAQDLKFFVQQHMPEGLELIMGARAEEGLGHSVMFGLGGIYVEVMKDVVFNLTPVSDTEAERMLKAIKMAPLLEGVRGRQGVNRRQLAEIIQRLSRLLTDLPEIREMDLNPLIAYEDRAVVVDARIRL
jgi:acetyltransferase